MILLNAGCGASAHTGQPRKTGWVHVNARILLAFATPTRMGDHRSLEAGGALVKVKWKWIWLR